MISEVDEFPGIFSKRQQNNQIYDTLNTVIFFWIIQIRNFGTNWGEKCKAVTWNVVTFIISSGIETLSENGVWDFINSV